MKRNVLRLAKFCLLVTSAAFADHSIYRELWDLDQTKNGLNTPKEIELNTQQKYTPRDARENAAPDSLFKRVKSPKLTAPVYKTVAALFDNYDFQEGNPEDKLGENPTEDKELTDFLSAIEKTEVFAAALQHINDEKLTDTTLTAQDLTRELKRIWFQPYTNHYRPAGDRKVPSISHCTGFEHVFVGEKSAADKLGGVHYWYKFYLDELKGEVDYLGHSFSSDKQAVAADNTHAEVVTFAASMTKGPLTAKKPVTGFMVGASPELTLVWGLIALLENNRHSDTEDMVIPVSLKHSDFELVLYRNMLVEEKRDTGIRGDVIRSFFPKLKAVH